jgi:hypothetical protein
MTEHEAYTETISTANFPSTPRLILEQPTGDVRIEGWDRPEVQVSVEDSAGTFEVEQEGSVVRVRTRPGKFKLVNFIEPAEEAFGSIRIGLQAAGLEELGARIERQVERSVRRIGRKFGHFDFGEWLHGGQDYTIRVPHECDLTLRTSSGDISVSNVSGTHYLQSTSGSIKLSRCSGNALVSSSSGDISVQDAQGNLAVRTVSGDISTQGLDVKELSVSTTSGDLTLDLLRLPDHPLELKSVSGDLTLYIPADARVTLEFSTISGDIDCGFPRSQVSYTARGRRGVNLSINGGGQTIRVQTVSGDISVLPGRRDSGRWEYKQTPQTPSHTADLSARQPAEEAAQPASEDLATPESYTSRQQKELEILQAVQRGELSAQEAMRRLSELDGEQSEQ